MIDCSHKRWSEHEQRLPYSYSYEGQHLTSLDPLFQIHVILIVGYPAKLKAARHTTVYVAQAQQLPVTTTDTMLKASTGFHNTCHSVNLLHISIGIWLRGEEAQLRHPLKPRHSLAHW